MKLIGANQIKSVQRRKSKKRHWSRQKRPLVVRREYIYLPTRETLTYAEAQKFVDVETDGEIHRLNISESLEIITEDVFEGIQKRKPAISSSSLRPSQPPSFDFEDSCSLPAISKLPQLVVRVIDDHEPTKTLFRRQASYFRNIDKSSEEQNEEVEYDMDEEDIAWLRRINNLRKKEKLVVLSADSFETVIDRLEKEAFILAVAGGDEFNGSTVTCEICLDNECQTSNDILKCDTCSLSVHQDCYGVPYLPEGPWLCRKCIKSPNVPVECCLCPVKDGALKQTDDGRWAHVLCAFWIPEVSFGSALYLEPVDKIDRIPAKRFGLKCGVCKVQGIGVCIKCHASDCHGSFHATCAMKAGLFMKMEPVQENGSLLNYRKTFFCDEHRPVETSLFHSGMFSQIHNNSSNSSPMSSCVKSQIRSKSKKLKKEIVEQPCSPSQTSQLMTVPTIPEKRLLAVSDHLNVRDKRQLIARLYCYWLLKRQSNNGLPLIQRLHSTIAAHQILRCRDGSDAALDENGLKFLKKLRQDLEKVRLLLELIRKREKLKCEFIKARETVVNLQLQPFSILLKHTLDQLQAKDLCTVFAYPVSLDEVPDYLDIVKSPMDFSTMRNKIDRHLYETMDDFEADFHQITENCITYNEKGTVLHKIAVKLKEEGRVSISAARRIAERADYCKETGLHRIHDLDVNDVQHDSTITKNLRSFETNLHDDNLEGRLKELLKRLDVSQVVRTGHNAALSKRLKKEISVCRRQLTLSRQDQQKIETIDQKHLNGVNVLIPGSCSISLSRLSSKSVQNASAIQSPRLSYDEPTTLCQEKVCNPARSQLNSADSLFRSMQNNSESLETLTSVEFNSSHSHKNKDRNDSLSVNDSLKRPNLHGTVALLPDIDSSKNRDKNFLKVSISPLLKPNGLVIECSSQNDSSVTTRSASRRLSQSSTGSRQFLKRSRRNTTTSSLNNNSSIPLHRQRTCGRFHMIAQTSCQAESTENDSSYESSYSMLSDSDLSKCNSPDSQNGGPLFIVAKHQYRKSCSVESIDIKTSFKSRDIIWAKSRGYPWYPAMIINPDNSENDIKILPPNDVLALRPKCEEPVYLIRFFDKRYNWQWLPHHKLEPLGVNSEFDVRKITEIKQFKLRRDVRRAYEEAIKTSNMTSIEIDRNTMMMPI